MGIPASNGESAGHDSVALTYALRWRVRSIANGSHRSRADGADGRFRDIVPFDRSPDPRRIDLRASLRDPFGGLHVRQFEQRVAACVHILLDSSASMAHDGGDGSAWQRAVDLAYLIDEAARATGDACGLVAAAATTRVDQPASRRGVRDALAALPTLMPSGHGIEALIEAAVALGERRRLVFVLSDFSFGAELAARLFDALAAHDVVPVRFGHRLLESLPRRGLGELVDMETGQRRLLWLRPRLREAWLTNARLRGERLAALSLRHGHALLDQPSVLDPEAVARHLLEH